MLLVEKNKNNIGIYCWDHFKRNNPKYGLLFFVSVFLIKKNQIKNEGYCCLVFR